MSVDYLKVINLIKEKKLLENTSDHFEPRSSVHNHYHDIAKAEAIQEQKRLRALETAAQNAEIDSMPSKDKEDYDQQLTDKVKEDKKSKQRDQLRIMSAFESLTDGFRGPVNEDKTAAEMGMKLNEKAGAIKKREREKTKKEKSLSAKLRLKAKKNK